MHTLTEGPLGFPLTEKQARSLEATLKSLPKDTDYAYRKTVLTKAPIELADGERSDVSWISTECVDRYNHVVLARGMDDSQFGLNPIVTLNHCYTMPPIGRSLWRKKIKDGFTRGVKAKTYYPEKPQSWGEDCWPPDKVLTLIQAGLLNGKSIGWLPTKLHWAEEPERSKNAWPDPTLVIEEWLLVEYAVGTLPVNPETVVEIVSKAAPTPEIIKALGWPEELFHVSASDGDKETGAEAQHGPGTPLSERILFTPLSEIESAINRRVKSIDLAQLVKDTFDRQRGRV